MTHTKFRHMTDAELIRLVQMSDCTQLEVELALRLEEAGDENRELLAAQMSLPGLSKT